MKKSRVVVFGGAGFLGSHVADKLLSYGHEVSVFDLAPSAYASREMETIQGDILNRDSVERAVAGAAAVYNFAGHADLDSASTDPVRTTELNLIGNLNIIEACVKAGVQHFVYASTIYVFSESGGFYRCSKQAAEIYIEEYNRKYGLAYTILRYGSLYGPRADERNSIYRYIQQAMNESRIVINGKGDEIREYIHVRDAAKVSARVLEPEYRNKRFVITGHQALPVQHMLEMIREILGKPVELIFDPKPDSDHYKITPYSFVPKVGEKFAPDIFTDMGQGLIECMADMSERGAIQKV
ncbi:MAG: NAD(P)-dependent oxidoreductase [Spirochaetales bacterium]|nr:NAD(P)-dependent oxidoreductase [Spirochaetales bacterium]MCP5484925.1 NAD(P)-dependent oxidoreductase [Spirochaetales bacterium]